MQRRPQIMGILNVTPDSFSDGGQFDTESAALAHARTLIKAGVDIIDIGGESTRPGAQPVSAAAETKRVVPLIKAVNALIKETEADVKVSVDTRKPSIAQKAIKDGADIWNDVSALTFDPDSPDMAAKLDCPVILMHAQGTPETMQDSPSYEDVIAQIKLALATRAASAIAAGVKKENIIIDPGIGFGKRLEDNLMIFRHLSVFKSLGFPLLMGASRKSFIGRIDGSDADARLGGSIAAALWSVRSGADIIRVHDAQETIQALKVWGAIADS